MSDAGDQHHREPERGAHMAKREHQHGGELSQPALHRTHDDGDQRQQQQAGQTTPEHKRAGHQDEQWFVPQALQIGAGVIHHLVCHCIWEQREQHRDNHKQQQIGRGERASTRPRPRAGGELTENRCDPAWYRPGHLSYVYCPSAMPES